MRKNPLTFDETDFESQAGRDGVLVWLTPKGDSLGLFHFAVPPDIEANLENVDGVRAFYARSAHEADLGVVETEVVTVDGCVAVRTIFKLAQGQAGRTYLGALTFPFRNFSYVFKVQSPEGGVTGIRESAVLAALMSRGTQALDTNTGQLSGWLDAPYDSNEAGPMTRNISERPEYDAQFPEHPLSRARWVLEHLQRTVVVDDDVKRQPKYIPMR